MTIESTETRTHIRCDECRKGWVFITGPIDVGLRGAGWVVDGERHVCPRCGRRGR